MTNLRGKPSPQKFLCRPSPREGAPREFRDRLHPSDLTPKLRPAPPRPPRRESAQSRVFGRKSSFFAFKAAISGTGVSKKGNPLANGAAGRLRKRRKSAGNARGNRATAAEKPTARRRRTPNPNPDGSGSRRRPRKENAARIKKKSAPTKSARSDPFPRSFAGGIRGLRRGRCRFLATLPLLGRNPFKT